MLRIKAGYFHQPLSRIAFNHLQGFEAFNAAALPFVEKTGWMR